MPSCRKKVFLYTIRQDDSLESIARRYHTTADAIAAANPDLDLNSLCAGQVINIYSRHECSASKQYEARKEISKAEFTLSNHLRTLWEQHVFWTRSVITSIVFSLPDAEPATSRLLRNPRDFELILRPLYGDRAAARFADLFTAHLVIAAQLVRAAKAGNTDAAAAAEKKWYANADEIAAFLAAANPFWSESSWRTMLYEHLALTKAEAVSMLTGSYGESISLFDEIERQALEMADMMTSGIVCQFPERFLE